jgi:hypothetical protein
MALEGVKRQKASSETGGLIELDFTLGLPPSNLLPETTNMIHNSMPIARIYPGIPSFREGLDLFTRLPAFNAPAGQTRASKSSGPLYYDTLLQKHGFKFTRNADHVEVAFLADSFPTDSFSNEYGENFLQKFTDVASEGAASLAQIAGGRSVSEAYTNYATQLASKKGVAGSIGKGALKAGDVARDLFGNMGGAGGMVHTVDKLMAGQRIDFPMVWKSSGFQPSYTMTVRLYNPDPGSERATQKYIVGPIAALMLLGIPVSDDGNTYSWPFIHRIVSDGIYDLDPAFISNITIVKGGDQQQISQKQSLGIVDVRIDFGSLFSTMLASSQDVAKSRPTLRKYLAGMGTTKAVYDYKGQALVNSKVISSTSPKIPKKVVEKTQSRKTNPVSRQTQAAVRVSPPIDKTVALAELQVQLEAAEAQLQACPSFPGLTTTCQISAWNDIERIEARIAEINAS